MASEIHPFAQLRLLKTLVEVKSSAWRSGDQPYAEKMDELTTELFWTTSDPQMCHLEDLGMFLIQILGVVSQLATSLAHGPHISTYTDKYIRDATREDDFSDMSIVKYLDTKHTLLKNLASELDSVSSKCEDLWMARPQPQQTWPPPTFQTESVVHYRTYSDTSASMPDIDRQSPRYGTSVLDDGTRRTSPAMGPGSDRSHYRVATDQSSAFTPLPLSSDPRLSLRGKGKHICPHGRSCTKGGVYADGAPVVFERNSLFRAHMAKHDKTFHCDIPGCTNKEGFARIDQLHRHKQSVRHKPIT